MFLSKIVSTFRYLPIKAITTKSVYRFTDRKIGIDEELLKWSETINEKNVREDFSSIVNDYIQLEESSFTEELKDHKSDPQMLLMFLSTFEDRNKICEFLPHLYPHIDFFEKQELVLLLENVLAFSPQVKPKVPFPKPLEGIESILVIMNEIYNADELINWIKYIPTYTARNLYVLFMGYFSILEKMSPEVKSRNQSLLIKCHEKIMETLSDEEENTEVRIGIVALAFELFYGQAPLLLAGTSVNFNETDPYKNCLLFINVSQYMHKRITFDPNFEENLPETVRSLVKKSVNEMVTSFLDIDFVQFMKIEMLVELWKSLSYQKELKGVYLTLSSKLAGLIANKSYTKSLSSLETSEVIIILSSMEKHKVNNEKALRTLLTFITPHLRNMSKDEFIQVLKCLVTYVRQCEKYLINARQILEERKLEFDSKDIFKVNEILKRVEVLFPKKFGLK